MSSSTLYRLSGIGLLIGGLLAAIGAVAQAFLSEDFLNPLWIPVAASIFIATLLIQVGLPAVYVRQMKQAGVLGLIGFILLFCGLIQFGIGFRFLDIVILPWVGKSIDINTPLTLIFYSLSAVAILLVGSILFGIAILRAGVLPKGPVVLLLVSIVLNRIASVPHLQDIGIVLFYLSFAWFGFALLSLPQREAERELAPTPVQ